MLFLSCEDPNFLSILLLSNKIIEIAQILIPIFLIVLVSIDISKQVFSEDVNFSTLKKIAASRLFAAVLVFLVPLIVFTVLSFVKPSFPRLAVCMNNANLETIKYLKDQREKEYKRMLELKEIKRKEQAEEAAKAEAELKKLLSEVTIDGMLEKGHGKLTEDQCALLKSRTTLVEWDKDLRYNNPTTILVHYDKCEFITIKDLGGSQHWDFVPATKEDSKVYYSWYNNEWSWNPRQGGLVYVDGKWATAAFHGCPHANGSSSSGITDSYFKNGASCAGSYDWYGHFCLHFRGSTVHSEGGRYDAVPNAAAQKEITRMLEDSKKYK